MRFKDQSCMDKSVLNVDALSWFAMFTGIIQELGVLQDITSETVEISRSMYGYGKVFLQITLFVC